METCTDQVARCRALRPPASTRSRPTGGLNVRGRAEAPQPGDTGRLRGRRRRWLRARRIALCDARRQTVAVSRSVRRFEFFWLVLKAALSAVLLLAVPVALGRLVTDFGFESVLGAVGAPLFAWWVVGGMWRSTPASDPDQRLAREGSDR